MLQIRVKASCGSDPMACWLYASPWCPNKALPVSMVRSEASSRLINAHHATALSMQANMDASFQRQKLQAKMEQLALSKDWHRVAGPDGSVNINALLSS